MTQEDYNNRIRTRMRIAGFLIAITISAALIHHSMIGILTNLRATGQTLEADAKDDSNNQYMVTCYENWNNPFAEYSFNEMRAKYKDLVLLKGTGINTSNPVQCSARLSSKMFTQEQVRNSIVFMGGAAASGKGLPRGSSFHDILQKMAVDRKGHPVKIVDFTLNSSDLSFVEKNFAVIAQMKPRMIVYIWSPADTPAHADGRQGVLADRKLLDQTNHFMSENSGPAEIILFNGAIKNITERRSAVQWYRKNHSETNRSGLETLLVTIKTMRDQAQAAGVDFKVAFFPLMQGRRNHYEFRDIHEKMGLALNRNSISYIDLAPGLFKNDPDELTVNVMNRRMNVKAHAYAANQLAPFLGLEKPDTIMDTGSAEARLRYSSIPAEKYAYAKDWPFCRLIFFLLMLLVCSFTIAFAFHLPEIVRQISSSGVKTALALFAITAYALWLRVAVSPHAHLVLGDEYDRLRIIEMWIAGVFGAQTYNVFPGAMAAYFPGYLIFGLHPHVGFHMSVFMSVLSCGFMFLVVKSLLKSNFAALTAALLMATYPVCLRFSGSQAAEIPNLLFMLICVYAFLVNRYRRDFISSLLFFIALSFFIFIRIHNIVFAAFLFYCYVQLNRADASSGAAESPTRIRGAIIRSRADLLPVIMFAACVVCCLVLMYISVTKGDYSRNLQKVAFSSNFVDNLRFFISNNYLPVVYSIFCCIALVMSILMKKIQMRKAIPFIASWIIIYFLCHLQAQSALYLKNSESVRHTIDFAAPLLALAAAGIFIVDQMLYAKAAKLIFRVCLFVFIVLAPFAHINEIKDSGYVDNVTRAALTVAERSPADTLFVTNSLIIHDAIDLDLRANARFIDSRLAAKRHCANQRDCVLVLLNYSHNKDFESMREMCPDSIHYIDLAVVICPIDKAGRIPANYFRPPFFETGGGNYQYNLPYGISLRQN